MNLDLVSEKYLANRAQILRYTYEDMNLKIDNAEQVYIALFDFPAQSLVAQNSLQSLALVFGLNVHIYNSDGSSMLGLEKDPDVMKAMQSALISIHQAIPSMKKVKDYSGLPDGEPQVFLKTKSGVYFKKISTEDRVDQFLLGMRNLVLRTISTKL